MVISKKIGKYTKIFDFVGITFIFTLNKNFENVFVKLKIMIFVKNEEKYFDFLFFHLFI